jgi:hypothetical protein
MASRGIFAEEWKGGGEGGNQNGLVFLFLPVLTGSTRRKENKRDKARRQNKTNPKAETKKGKDKARQVSVSVNTTQRNTTQHNSKQHNATQLNSTQHNTTAAVPSASQTGRTHRLSKDKKI